MDADVCVCAEFLPKYVNINGVQFQCFIGKKNFHITDIWVRNAKINFFEEKCVYCAAFIKLKCRRFHTGLVDWKKHQTLEIWLLSAFVRTS